MIYKLLPVFYICFLIVLLPACGKTNEGSLMIQGNHTYKISSGNVSLTTGPADGGRIISFKLGSYEFLTDREINSENFGSTLWPSPQTYWGWPPPAVLDTEMYTVEDSGKVIKLESGKDPVTGYQFEKTFSAGKPNHIKLTYTIINTTNEIKKVAPWEIARTPKCGLFFFPMGDTTMGKKIFQPVNTDRIDGILWYEDKLPRPDDHRLSYADGIEGWQAYAIDGKIFIKKFEDVKPENQAPGEGEILFYISCTHDYIEIELEGKYEELQPGAKSEWSIEWIAMDIPAGIKVKKGSRELVDFVRSVVK